MRNLGLPESSSMAEQTKPGGYDQADGNELRDKRGVF